jgi:hypothetical protein
MGTRTSMANKNHGLFEIKNLVRVIVITCVGTGLACGIANHSGPAQPVQINGARVGKTLPIEPPQGDEIELTVHVLEPKKAVITIRNVSAKSLYVPYMTGERNGFAYFINYELQKKDEQTGEWVALPPPDLGSGFQPLESREIIKGRLMAPESGTFRLALVYMVDSRVFEKMSQISKIRNVKERLENYDNISEWTDAAQMEIMSDPFTF